MLQSFGDPSKPVLLCIPGLLGGAEDFDAIVNPLIENYHILVFDPNAERREFGVSGLTMEVMQEIKFDCSADEIASELAKITKEPVVVCGISLGGKIVYDFCHKYPEKYRAAVITDVSPGSFGPSALFQFIDSLVSNLNLNQPWNELKKELRSKIDDNSLRVLIQTQLFYPTRVPPAAWKVGMKHFGDLLERQSLDNQFDPLFKIDEALAKAKKFIHVFTADHLGAIDRSSQEMIENLKSFKIHPLKNASHFLHVTHKDLITQLLMDLSDLQRDPETIVV